MSIITLISDMGHKDFYVAAIKGKILKQIDKPVTIVDVTHSVPPFDIQYAAFTLKNIYEEFPEGTVHIISVDSEITPRINPIIVKHKNQYFIGADNGIFSLAFDGIPENIYEITIKQDSDLLTFPTKTLFIKAACHLARGGTPEIIAKKITSITIKQTFRPVVNNNTLRGSVVYIDNYGNIITNISKRLFKEVGRGRKFSIFFRNYDIDKISQSYFEAPLGEMVALFNSTDNLEIAINKGVRGGGGSASQLLGLKLNEIISIEFL